MKKCVHIQQLLALLLLQALFSVCPADAQQSRRLDSLALVELYNATDGDNWFERDHWLSDKPIDQWEHVTVEDNRVVGLDLGFNNLSGALPDSLPGLDGLLVLWLHNNALTGTVPVYANMKSLQEMDFGFNAFTGTIPDSLHKLSSLKALWLNDNSLSGTVPATMSELHNLSFLNISDNQLSGDIPAELASMDTLSYLDVSGNDFTSLPDFSSSRVMANIRCHRNQLDFGDLLPNADVRNFVYAPQDTIGRFVDTTVSGGSTLRLYVNDPQPGNSYQWFFNGNAMLAERDTVFEEYNMTNAKAGLYHYETTNAALPELSLVARPTLVQLTLSPLELRDTVVCRGRNLRLNPSVQGGILPYQVHWSPGDAVTDSTSLLTFATFVSDTTELRLTVTDAVGTTVSSTMAVLVADFPEKPSIVKSGNAMYCTTRGQSYQWYFNGKGIPGARDTVFILNIPGFYSVVVSNFGCSVESDELRVDSLATGIENDLTQSPLRLKINNRSVSISGLVAGEQVLNIQLFDVHGRAVGSIEPQTSGYISLHSYARGTYFARVETTVRNIVLQFALP